MTAKEWIKASWFALLGRDYDPKPPVERKSQFRAPIPAYNPLYGPSSSGEKTHIVRQLSRGSVYLCGTPVPSGLQLLRTYSPDPDSLCTTCSNLFQGGAR